MSKDRTAWRRIRDLDPACPELERARHAATRLSVILGNPTAQCGDLQAAMNRTFTAVEDLAELLFDSEGFGDVRIEFDGDRVHLIEPDPRGCS